MLVTAMELPHLLPPRAWRVTDTQCKRSAHVYVYTVERARALSLSHTHTHTYTHTHIFRTQLCSQKEAHKRARASKRIARTQKNILAERLYTRARSNTRIYTRAMNAIVAVAVRRRRRHRRHRRGLETATPPCHLGMCREYRRST